MKKVVTIVFILSPFFLIAQDNLSQEIELTPKVRELADIYTYQVVVFKHGTIVPIKEKQENVEEFAKNELLNSVEDPYGLSFHALMHAPRNFEWYLVTDYKDIRNLVMANGNSSIPAMNIAKACRKKDSENLEILYVSKK